MKATIGHRHEYRVIPPEEAQRFHVRCCECERPATVVEHDHYRQQGSKYLFFYYFCSDHDPRRQSA